MIYELTCDVMSTDYLFLRGRWRYEDARRDKDQFSSPQGWAGHSVSVDQGLSFLHLLIKMRERRYYKLPGLGIRVNVLKNWVPLIDIGSVSNSRKDFLEPDLIENISAESIAKTDLEN